VDVRIALDIVRFALETRYEVALIFSHDQDLSEAVQDVKKISMLKNRFPASPTVRSPKPGASTARIGSVSIGPPTTPASTPTTTGRIKPPLLLGLEYRLPRSTLP